MNCSNCNNALPQDAHFCTHCGSPVVFTPQTGQYYASGSVFPGSIFPGKVTRNLQSLGVLWLVYAGLRLLSGLAGGFLLARLFWPPQRLQRRHSTVRAGICVSLAGGPDVPDGQRRLRSSHGIWADDAAAMGAHSGHHLRDLCTHSHPVRHSDRHLHPLGARFSNERR